MWISINIPIGDINLYVLSQLKQNPLTDPIRDDKQVTINSTDSTVGTENELSEKNSERAALLTHYENF